MQVTEKAIKNDGEKPRMGLLPPDVLLLIARGFTMGAKKYSAWNWTRGFEWSRLYDALQRHLTAWNSGETIDANSGLPHLALAGCELFMLAAHELRGLGKDDRHVIAPARSVEHRKLDAYYQGQDPLAETQPTCPCERAGGMPDGDLIPNATCPAHGTRKDPTPIKPLAAPTRCTCTRMTGRGITEEDPRCPEHGVERPGQTVMSRHP